MYKKLFDNPTYKKYNKSSMGGSKVSEVDFKKMALARAKETESFIISKYMTRFPGFNLFTTII